jgi:hypothetical protein
MDRIPCTCSPVQAPCPACLAWQRSERLRGVLGSGRPRRSRPDQAHADSCAVHAKFHKGCTPCQAQNRRYHAGRRSVRAEARNA